MHNFWIFSGNSYL